MLKTCLHCGLQFDGSPQARFHSDACRKAYARELGQRETENSDKRGPAEELGQVLPPPSSLPPRKAPLTEQEYVEQTLAEALAFSIEIGETDAPIKLGTETLANRRRDRLRRAERYARWRYQGYLSGEVASL